MMTKEQYVDYWMNTAEEDWTTVGVLFAMERYLHCLYWAHLMLEKLANALWIKNNSDNIPPKSHDIVWLLGESKVDLGKDYTEFLYKFNRFQLLDQSLDHTSKLYQACTKEFTAHELKKVKEVRAFLIEILP